MIKKIPDYKVIIYFVDGSVPNKGFITGMDSDFLFFDDVYDGSVIIGKHAIKRIVKFKDKVEVDV